MSEIKSSGTNLAEAHTPGYRPPSYEDVVETYGLAILKAGGALSVENGEIAMTKDGDLKLGDTVHNALFRLVQAWRLNAPHLRFLFELVRSMLIRRKNLGEKMNKIGNEQSADFDTGKYPEVETEVIRRFHEVIDEQGAAEYGYATYAGCVVLLLSGSLLRFKNDIEGTATDWNKAAPLFNGCSVGQVIVAAANGFRHDDEWTKTRPSTPKQRASQKVLATALRGTLANHGRAPGRCPEVLDMLSRGGDFDRLTENLFTFAHNVALGRRAAFEP